MGQAFVLNSAPRFLYVWFVVVQLTLSLWESISTLELSKKGGELLHGNFQSSQNPARTVFIAQILQFPCLHST